MDSRLLIGQVAKEVGLNPKLIRYYEKVGLIPPLPRSESGYHSSGYRLFTPEHVRRLEFIKHARLLNLPLADIRELATAHEAGCCGDTRPRLRALLEVKRRELDEKIRDLQLLRGDLERLCQDLTTTPPNPQEEAECRSGASACECLFGIVPVASIKETGGETMEPKTALKSEAQLTQEQSAEECCVPECGPDTCGGANVPVSVNTLVKAKSQLNPDGTLTVLQAASGGCCEPECGPDTCEPQAN